MSHACLSSSANIEAAIDLLWAQSAAADALAVPSSLGFGHIQGGLPPLIPLPVGVTALARVVFPSLPSSSVWRKVIFHTLRPQVAFACGHIYRSTSTTSTGRAPHGPGFAEKARARETSENNPLASDMSGPSNTRYNSEVAAVRSTCSLFVVPPVLRPGIWLNLILCRDHACALFDILGLSSRALCHVLIFSWARQRTVILALLVVSSVHGGATISALDSVGR